MITPPAPYDLGAAVKPVDSWWTVAVIDPLAMRVLPVLLRARRATPNAVTGVAFVVGLASIVAFAGRHWVLGAVLYELRFFLDCIDGKIARVRRLSSPTGAMFDRLADMATIPAVFATIGLVLASQGHLPERVALLTAVAALLVSGLEAVLEVARLKGPTVASAVGSSPGGSSPGGGAIAWARRHRLTLRPWTVEAETIGLFLGPLVLRGGALAGLHLALVGVYALFAAVDVALIMRVTGGNATGGAASST